MATVRIVSKGNTLDGSELDNIASEETLLALLEQLKIINGGASEIKKESTKTKTNTDKHFDLLGKVIGKNKADTVQHIFNAIKGVGAGEAGSAGGLIAKIAPELAVMTAFIAVLDVAKNTFFGLVNTSALLVKSFVDGQSSLSDYTKALAAGTQHILIIGTLVGLFSKGIEIIDSWNNKLYELNTVGAGFNNSLIEMRQRAADAGLSLEDYSKIIIANKDNFATFGSIMNGVNTYNKIATISMRDYTDQLANMGISLSQYQEELPGVLSLFGASMKAHGASDKQLASSAIELTSQFDAMAKLTGKTREQQVADMQKLTADAAWKLKLSEMSDSERTQELAALNEVNSTMGATAAELYKMKVLGIVPLGKEMQILMATVPGLDRQFTEMSQLAAQGKLLPGEMDRRIAEMVGSGLRAGKGLEQILKAATSGIGGTPETIAKIQSELMANSQSFLDKNGVFNEELFRQNLATVRAQADKEDGIRKSLAEWNSSVKLLQDFFFQKILQPIMYKLAPIISNIVKKFEAKQGSLQGLIDGVVNIVVGFVGIVGSIVSFVMNNWGLIKIIFDVLLVLGVAFLGAVIGITLAAVGLSIALAPAALITGALLGGLVALVALLASIGLISMPTLPSVAGITSAKIPSMPKLSSMENATSENTSVFQPPTNVQSITSENSSSTIGSKLDDHYAILQQIRDSIQQTANNTHKLHQITVAGQ